MRNLDVHKYAQPGVVRAIVCSVVIDAGVAAVTSSCETVSRSFSCTLHAYCLTAEPVAFSATRCNASSTPVSSRTNLVEESCGLVSPDVCAEGPLIKTRRRCCATTKSGDARCSYGTRRLSRTASSGCLGSSYALRPAASGLSWKTTCRLSCSSWRPERRCVRRTHTHIHIHVTCSSPVAPANRRVTA
jgi:hypothetical protein